MAVSLFGFLFVILAIQRASELFISKRNEKWLREQGAVEYGKEHYFVVVLMHSMFFVSMLVEFYFRGGGYTPGMFHFILLGIVIILQFLRIWVMTSLGRNWNTKIFWISGNKPEKKGPYKFIRHPSYTIVLIEIFIFPLIFDLWYTAIIFTIINSFVLYFRIKVENYVFGEN